MPTKIDLHLISFDIPYPPENGGLIDVLCKLQALKEEGLQIALHCFEYGRERTAKLNEFAAEVHYYPRNTGISAQFSRMPYIIRGRDNKKLLNRLKADRAPIFFEGVHSCFFIDHPDLKRRKKAVRIHNREDQYYHALSEQTEVFWKKLYYRLESFKLNKWEKRLMAADQLFCLSKSERDYYDAIHQSVHYLPVFHPYEASDVESNELVDQALYYGDLSVEENQKAAEFLIEVFSTLDKPLLIAGRNPSAALLRRIENRENAMGSFDLSDMELETQIHRSRVCCLPTFQDTGIKLKWLHALFSAKDILVNRKMLAEREFEVHCHLAEEIEDWRNKLQTIFGSKVDEKAIKARQQLAARHFNNSEGAKVLVEWCAQAQ